MSKTTSKTSSGATPARLAVVGLLAALALFALYRLAPARGGAPTAGGTAYAPATGAAVPVDADGVQRITIDTSSGSYSPGTVKLAPGVPAEITFKQAGGCLGQVMSEQLGFFEDLSTGDKTVKLGALTAGRYDFSCGMRMVFGQIVVG